MNYKITFLPIGCMLISLRISVSIIDITDISVSYTPTIHMSHRTTTTKISFCCLEYYLDK